MELSVIIVNWNGKNVLRDCLSSIYRIRHRVDFEVIVVDNASSDDSVRMLQSEFPTVRVLCNPSNLGFAAGNNLGFALAHGRHVLLLNSDTLVLAGALDESVRYLDEHPDVGVVGCRVEFPDGSFQTSCYRFSDPWVLFMARLLPLGTVASERLNFGRYLGRQFRIPTEVDCVAGCFMVVRRKVICDCGGLDEDFFMYGEDEEWCGRIKLKGWKVVYFPDVTIIHIHRFSSRQAKRHIRVIECASPMLVLHKRRGHPVAWIGNLVMLAAIVVRIPAWIIMDVVRLTLGDFNQELLQNRVMILMIHFMGLFKPVWLPLKNEGSEVPKARTVT